MRVTAYSYAASGVSNGGSMQGNVSTNRTRYTSGSRKSSNQKAKKKPVKYNPREIRNALTQASKAQSAGRVLCQAQTKLTSLLKCKGTGQYNERELANAIVHARRMVRCARMKTKNLKQEEQIQRKHAKEAKAEEQQRKNDLKVRVKQKEQNLRQKARLEKLQKLQKQKQKQMELEQRRRLHRILEKGEMDEADLEYTKGMSDSEDGPEIMAYQPAYYPAAGVELELSDDGMELTEAQIEAQIEQQVEMMVRAELAMGDGGMPEASTGGAVMTGAEMPVIDAVAGEG